MSRGLALFAAAVLLAHPDVALACSTCMDPREGNRTLLSVTVFLSLLPLALMASLGGYYWWHLRAARSGTLAAATSPLPTSPSDPR